MGVILSFGFGGGYFLITNSQEIRDQITAWQNPLPLAVAKLADQAGLNARGRFLLQVTRAQVDGRSAFNAHCSNVDESQSIVLGCYTGRIYVFDVTDPSVSGIKAVIAAHEMLHAAYARLSSSEKTKIDNEINDYIPKIQNTDIKKSLAIYAKTEPGDELNELHSLLGTEEKNLPTDLEDYYKSYFSNRTMVVTAYGKYAEVFSGIQNQQAQLSQQLSSLRSKIDIAVNKYKGDSQDLSNDITNFNTCASKIDCLTSTELSAQRGVLLERQKALSTAETSINDMVNEYNQLVNQLIRLGVETKKLNSDLDSRAVMPQ